MQDFDDSLSPDDQVPDDRDDPDDDDFDYDFDDHFEEETEEEVAEAEAIHEGDFTSPQESGSIVNPGGTQSPTDSTGEQGKKTSG